MESRSSTVSYYHADSLGSTRSLTSSSQSQTDTFRFDAFGLNTGRTGSNATPFGFVGGKGYQSDSSGLMLLGHRYYDASTGRFLSRDPIQDGYNWYTYCKNDPVNKNDSTGCIAAIDDLIAVAAVGFLVVAAITISNWLKDHPIQMPTIVWAKPPDETPSDGRPPGSGTPLESTGDPALDDAIHRAIGKRKFDSNHDLTQDEIDDAIDEAKESYKPPTKRRGEGRGGRNWPRD